MKGTIHVCATPIGNLEDVTMRALRMLKEADVVVAEDTRRTRKLLSRYEIHARLIAFHQANERSQLQKLLDMLEKGKRLALVSDAGMPGISDPGYLLISAAIERGFGVDVIPGPSAVTAALVASGLPSDRFLFEGFLPRKKVDRQQRIRELVPERRTVVLFEAPGRMLATLRELHAALGNRKAAIVRELTKAHEEVSRGMLSDLIGGAASHEEGPRGEITLVIGGVSDSEGSEAARIESAIAAARGLMEDGSTRSRAAAEAARKYGVKKADVYDEL